MDPYVLYNDPKCFLDVHLSEIAVNSRFSALFLTLE